VNIGESVNLRISALINVAKLRNGGAIARKRDELEQGIANLIEHKVGIVTDYYTIAPETVEGDLIKNGRVTRVFYEYDTTGVTCLLANDNDVVAKHKHHCLPELYANPVEMELRAFRGAVEILTDERAEQDMLEAREQEKAVQAGEAN